MDRRREAVCCKEGEWSDWIPIVFETGLPGSTVVNAVGNANQPELYHPPLRSRGPSVYRYLRQSLADRSVESGESGQLSAGVVGRVGEADRRGGGMYTTGIPEDTKALRSRPSAKTLDGERMLTALDEDAFLGMAHELVEERNKQYHDALANFKEGFLYYYFGHTDQLAHVFYRDMDPLHPGRKPEQAGRLYQHHFPDLRGNGPADRRGVGGHGR